MVVINENTLKINQSQIEEMVYIMIHEIMHILAFSPTLYGLYPTEEPAFK